MGLAERRPGAPADAVSCPASDFSRDAAMLAVAARVDGLSRERYDAAVDAGELVVAHAIRGAIHALAPADQSLWGRALMARDDDELTAQLGEQVKRLRAELGFRTTAAVAEVTAAIEDALGGGAALDRNRLHDALRQRVRDELLPWCKGCKSHHVAPMMWRYATIAAGARLDAQRRYVLGMPGRAPKANEAVRRFLAFYGPSTPTLFADWTGVTRPHGRRLWLELENELTEVQLGKTTTWLLDADRAELDSPPQVTGIRLIPPGDPYLQAPNRALLTPAPELRKRLFRPVSSPGAVLKDGRLAGLWRASAKGKKAQVTVEPLNSLRPADVEEEAHGVADLRGAELELVFA